MVLIGKSIIRLLIDKKNIVVNFDIVNFNFSHKNYFFLKTDITNLKSVDESLQYVKNNMGPLYGLVNNAYPRTKDWGTEFDKISYDSWSKNIDFQMNSTFYIIQKCSEMMIENGNGSIVNIASIYGVVGNDMTIYEGTEITPPAQYAAIKGGLISFTRYLASYYGQKSIRINCISPGGIFDNQNPIFVEKYCNKVPLKRMGNPDDISFPVSFLLSDDSKYITGHNLVVDGGWTII